jgi:hypothetical protein
MKEAKIEREYKPTVIPERIKIIVNAWVPWESVDGKLYPTVLKVITVKNKESMNVQPSKIMYPTVPTNTIRIIILSEIRRR